MFSTLTNGLTLTGALGGLTATVLNGCLRPQSQICGRTIVAGRDPLELALTYDDGPNDAATYDLLEVLAGYSVRATFFMIGSYVLQRPQIARAVHAAGHLVGNHTMTHPFLPTVSSARIRHELADCSKAIEDTLGVSVRYMRPPHGARRPAVMRIARELDLKVVQWNVAGKDWEPIGVDGILRHLDRGLNRARRRSHGANLLLHDGSQLGMGTNRADTVAATARLLERSSLAGSKFVTVDAWG